MKENTKSVLFSILIIAIGISLLILIFWGVYIGDEQAKDRREMCLNSIQSSAILKEYGYIIDYDNFEDSYLECWYYPDFQSSELKVKRIK